MKMQISKTKSTTNIKCVNIASQSGGMYLYTALF